MSSLFGQVFRIRYDEPGPALRLVRGALHRVAASFGPSEQAREGDLTGQSDILSTGKTPFAARDIPVVINNILKKDPSKRCGPRCLNA